MFDRARDRAVRALAFVLLCATALPAQAPQPLYMPRAVKRAFAKGTRSLDGQPGAKYWQNRGRYAITMTAAPPDRTIRGTEQIVYMNNSPDTLHTLGRSSCSSTSISPGAPRDERRVCRLSDVGRAHRCVHGERTARADGADDPTALHRGSRVALPTPLLPHDSVRLSFDWHYEISKESGPRGDARLDDVLPGVLLSARRRVRRLQRLGHDGLHRRAGVLQRLQRLRRDACACRANYVVWGTGTLRQRGRACCSRPSLDALPVVAARPTPTIHVATRERHAAKSRHARRHDERLALPRDEHPRHDVQPERPLRWDARERRRR